MENKAIKFGAICVAIIMFILILITLISNFIKDDFYIGDSSEITKTICEEGICTLYLKNGFVVKSESPVMSGQSVVLFVQDESK